MTMDSKHQNRGKSKIGSRRGSILIGLVITLLIMVIAGVATVYLTTGSTYTEILKNNNVKAYYLAESGGRVAYPLIYSDLLNGNQTNMQALFGTNLSNTPTYTLSTGTFTLSISNVTSTSALLTSVGTVNSGSWLQTKRNVVYSVGAVPVSGSGPSNSPSSSFYNQTNFNNDWITGPGTTASPGTSTGPSAGTALMFKGGSGFIAMNWTAGSVVPSSYDIQLKINVNAQGSHGKFYLLGLSFRLSLDSSNNPQNCYGISFFRNDGSAPSSWPSSLVTALSSIPGSANEYIVLWKEINGTYSLIDYRQLTQSDGVLNSDGTLATWSTIIITLNQKIAGGSNSISSYIAGPATYPYGTVNWQFSSFTPVSWHANGTNPIVDSSLTTAQAPEIGIHSFYDSNAANDQFFADFTVLPTSSGNGGTGSSQQYY